MSEGLHAALAKVQANLPVVGKGHTADTGKYTYKFASLSDVNDAMLPVLASHALTWTCTVEVDADVRVLVGRLTHAPTGEVITSAWPLPGGDDPQRIGSAVTYAKRYLLCALVGLAPDDDDDGRRAAQPAPVDTTEVEAALHDAKEAGVDAKHRDARKIMPYARESQSNADQAARVLRKRIAEMSEGSGPDGDGEASSGPDESVRWEAAYGDLGVQPERLLIELQTMWPKNDAPSRPTRTQHLDAAYARHPEVFAEAIDNLTPEADDG